MNWSKRAFKSVTYHKKNSILMFLIFFVLSILILFGLCIRTASSARIQEIRRSIGAVIQIEDTQIYSQEKRGENSITYEKYEMLLEDERVNSGSCTAISVAYAVDFMPEFLGEQDKDFAGKENVYLTGLSDMTTCLEVLGSDAGLVSGSIPKEEREVLINKTIADFNGLTVGDEITITSPYTEENITLSISGIYDNPYAIGNEQASVYLNPSNNLIVPAEVVFTVNENNNVDKITLNMRDPLECKEFVEDAKALPEIIKTEFWMNYTINDSQYRSIAGSLTSMIGLSNLMVLISIILGIITLSFLILLALRDRMFEIGVLLSMGETRGRIMLQMLTESLVPILLAITAGVVVSFPISGFIRDSIDLSAGVTVAVGSVQIGLLYLCGIVLTILASLVMVYKIARYQPKRILMDTE